MFEDKLDVLPEELLALVNIRSVYNYIARNKNNELVAFVSIPVKDEDGGVWKDSEGKRHYTLFEKDYKYFSYLKWENQNPLKINKLIGGNYKEGEII